MGFSIIDMLGGSIGETVAKIISAFKVDPTVALEKQTEIDEIKLQLASKLQDQFNQQLQAQTDINKQEAASTNWFVAGWRPFFGWVGGVAFAIEFIISPFATWIAALAGHPIKFPSLDMSTLMPVTMGMLGLGYFRTYEKVKGVDDTHPSE